LHIARLRRLPYKVAIVESLESRIDVMIFHCRGFASKVPTKDALRLNVAVMFGPVFEQAVSNVFRFVC
jgi:hypothetical protein